MDPVLIVGAVVLISVLGGARFVAIRRAAVGDDRFVGLFCMPTLLGGVVVMWAGLKVAGTSLPIGLLILAGGGVTTVLVARMIVTGPTIARRMVSSGDLSGPYFDYIIWLAIGLPMLLLVGLVILAIGGGLTSR
jgi:hypothetical protein